MRKVEKTGALLGADSQTQTIYTLPQTQLPRYINYLKGQLMDFMLGIIQKSAFHKDWVVTFYI